MIEGIIIAGVIYVIVDFVLAVALDRCVMPGLRCRACRQVILLKKRVEEEIGEKL